MPPIRLADTLHTPSAQLENWGPAKQPEGALISAVRGRSIGVGTTSHLMDMGVWECSPGRFRRQIMMAEYAHIICGRARFYPDRGEPFDICAGDAVFFPMNTTGLWDVTETLRKSYVVIDLSTGGPLLRFFLRKARRLMNALIPRSIAKGHYG